MTISGVRADDKPATRIAARAEADKRCQFMSRDQPRSGEPRDAGSRADGVHCVPFGMSTYGSFGASAKAELSRLMHEYASQGVKLLAESPHAPLEDVLQKLATTVYALNAVAILDARSALGAPDARVVDVARNSGLGNVIGMRFRAEAARLREAGGRSGGANVGPALGRRLLPGSIRPLVVDPLVSGARSNAGVVVEGPERSGRI